MATIAEISSYGPGQPIVGLQAVVKSCYDPKPFGQQGTFQNAVIADASGEVNAQFIDVEVYQGQPFMATSQQTTKKELGQERVVWDGAAYTEEYKGKFRFTIKKKGFTALAGGPAAPAPAPQPAYPPSGYQPGYGPAVAPGQPTGWQPTPPPQASAAQYAAQAAPPYTQAAPQPAGAAWGPSAALPPVGSVQRPDPAWFGSAAAPAAPASIQGSQQAQAPAKAPWQPAPKMGEAECRGLFEKNYLLFVENIRRDFELSHVNELPGEVVAAAMAWSTSIVIGIQRGDVIREPEADGEGGEPWAADTRPAEAMSPAAGAGLPETPEEFDF